MATSPQGAPLQFLIRVSGTTLANHLYFVSCTHAPPSAGPASATAPAQAPDVTVPPAAPPVSSEGITPKAPAAASASLSAVKGWDEFVAGLSAPQRALLDGLIAHPSPDMYVAFVRSLTPDQAATWATLAPAARLMPAGAPAVRATSGGQGLVTTGSSGLPAWAVWQMSATTTLAGRVVSYNLTNTSNKTLVVDAARLRVVGANGTPISGVSLSRRSTSGFEGRVPPGQAESGVIWIPTTPTGEVILRWPIVEIGTEIVYTINQRIS